MAAAAPDLHAQMVDAVLAGDGLDAVATLAAEAAGGAVAIVLPALGSTAAGGGGEGRLPAVRRYVAAGLTGQPRALPPGFLADTEIRSGDHDLGAVVLLDDGRVPAPTADGILRLAAVAALTAAAVHDTAGAGVRAAAALLDDLRRVELDADALIPRALRLGTDLSAGAVALRARVVPERALRAVSAIEDAVPGALVARRGEEIDALLPGDGVAVEQRAHHLAERLEGAAAVGLSAHEHAPGRLHRALREAEVALQLVRDGVAGSAEAAAGTWQLLVRVAVSDVAALRRLRDTSVGAALAHDAAHGTDVVGTLRTYLANDANMKATAAMIPAHRHTVAYRLDRLRTLTGLDPAQTDDRERLGLGIKAARVLDALAR
jgi:PucR family transcriptional regulator, purine catabolism regulatory protein